MPSTNHTERGRLISLERLNGVGKTYLTTRVAAADHGQPPLVVKGFSRRCDNDSDLGRRLLHTLVTASHGERPDTRVPGLGVGNLGGNRGLDTCRPA